MARGGGTKAPTESSGHDNKSDISEEWEPMHLPHDRLKAASVLVTTPAFCLTVDIRWDKTSWPDKGRWCSDVVAGLY